MLLLFSYCWRKFCGPTVPVGSRLQHLVPTKLFHFKRNRNSTIIGVHYAVLWSLFEGIFLKVTHLSRDFFIKTQKELMQQWLQGGNNS